LLKARDYPAVACQALKEMHRQVGELKIDEQGLAKRGVLVRHLVMPGDVAGSGEIMDFLAKALSVDTFVNIMDQYHPANKVRGAQYEEINRGITSRELGQAYDLAREAKLWRFDPRRPRWVIGR
jgi:putative pyruvate formate lyase activating enzyme